MDNRAAEDPLPDTKDLCGWRQAVESGAYRDFRSETIVAAIQDLGTGTDQAVLNPLAKELSERMLRLLRNRVYTTHPNRGRDIIFEVHGQLWQAVLKPASADGIGLREAFVLRLEYRMKDALSKLGRHVAKEESQAPDELDSEAACKPAAGKKSKGKVILDQSMVDTAPAVEVPEGERLDVEAVLERINDPLKRLAFRLHMDHVPFISKKGESIQKALEGDKQSIIPESTIRVWVNEIKALLREDKRVLDLMSHRTGDQS